MKRIKRATIFFVTCLSIGLVFKAITGIAIVVPITFVVGVFCFFGSLFSSDQSI